MTFMGGHDDILLPMVPGSEISGEVLEVGEKCRQGLKAGDKVVSIQSKLRGSLKCKTILGQGNLERFCPFTVHIYPLKLTEVSLASIY